MADACFSRRAVLRATIPTIAGAAALSATAVQAKPSELAELIADAEWRHAEFKTVNDALDRVEREFEAQNPYPFVTHGRRLLRNTAGEILLDPVTGEQLHKPWEFYTEDCIDWHFRGVTVNCFPLERVAAAEQLKSELKQKLAALKDEDDRRFEACGGVALLNQSDAAFWAWREARHAIYRFVPVTIADFQLKHAFLRDMLELGFFLNPEQVLAAVFGDEPELGDEG